MDNNDEGDEEIFEDAFEVQPEYDALNLDTALMECKAALDLFFNNRFDEARLLLSPGVGKSMYHTMGNAVFLYIEAVLTFDQSIITKASEALKSCIDLCNKYRRKSTLSESLGRMVKKSNSNTITPEELHAELCYAEALLLKSLLTFIEDETLVSFIKAGLKIRTCYNSYKECNNILTTKKWTNEAHKVHFESGVHVGIGAFNLMISFLPSRVIKLLEFIGFSGNKEVGLAELAKCYQLKDGIRQVLSVMTILSYNLISIYVLSHEEGDLELSNKILEDQLQLYPDGLWFLYFKGRLEFMKCNISEANKFYIKSWKSQHVWPQFHHLCFWELMWTYCVILDWKEALVYASNLLKSSKWSRTIYAYQKISMLLMMPSLSSEEKEEINTLVQKIPYWRQRFAGKSLPMEKFCIRRCERYESQKFLILPAIELMYLWNLFKVIGKKWDLCHSIYQMILKSISDFESGKFASEFEYDNKALLLLLKGACLFQLKSYFQAEDCFKQVISMEKKIKIDTFLVPFASVELSLVYAKQGENQKAIHLLENVKKNYSGYSLESRLHFRIHSALLDFASFNKKFSEATQAC
ncbi:tetratricopeptide repeat protein 39B isoform X1 [Halyomorpha halys]|uniref:tetratricopeptide repeat protein 39B isoform X1 n=2 Tax=Halyomorpha halys TaxID=286706 RepID=UPI0006D4F664